MDRLVFHVDVNSAFLSWEAARRVANGEPDIRLIPSAIGGDREKRTGVVLAKSIPAKKFGIKTGEPIGMALRKCPDLFLARPDFRLYEANSKKFMDICREYAPVVEKASIDECYLDFTGTHRIYPDPVALAHTIKNRIRDELGFTVNVGIGSNKLLAKMASDFEKPDKVHTLLFSEMPTKMWPLPVGELFTVGGATADKLRHGTLYRKFADRQLVVQRGKRYDYRRRPLISAPTGVKICTPPPRFAPHPVFGLHPICTLGKAKCTPPKSEMHPIYETLLNLFVIPNKRRSG